MRPTIWTDRVAYVDVGDGAQMTVPVGEWLWQMNHVRPEPDRGVKCDDRMLAVSVIESYLYLVRECTKEEAWRRIKILRAALLSPPSEEEHPNGQNAR